jgi:hypothetical protein
MSSITKRVLMEGSEEPLPLSVIKGCPITREIRDKERNYQELEGD